METPKGDSKTILILLLEVWWGSYFVKKPGKLVVGAFPASV